MNSTIDNSDVNIISFNIIHTLSLYVELQFIMMMISLCTKYSLDMHKLSLIVLPARGTWVGCLLFKEDRSWSLNFSREFEVLRLMIICNNISTLKSQLHVLVFVNGRIWISQSSQSKSRCPYKQVRNWSNVVGTIRIYTRHFIEHILGTRAYIQKQIDNSISSYTKQYNYSCQLLLTNNEQNPITSSILIWQSIWIKPLIIYN